MFSSLQLDQQYAALMGHHPYGIALYHPLTQYLLYPGACGYFDDVGAWNPIVSLDDLAGLKALGLQPLLPGDMQRAPTDNNTSWGPKISQDTQARKVSLAAGVDITVATGIPAEVSAEYAFTSTRDIGAVLLTSAPITHERLYHTSPFTQWAAANARVLLQRRPELGKHELWIVTSTYASQKAAIRMWAGKGLSVRVGFALRAVGIGECAPSGEWYRDKRDEDWGLYQSAKPDDKFVVFFSGLKFQYRWFPGKPLKQVTGKEATKFRGDAPAETLKKGMSTVVTTFEAPPADGLCQVPLRQGNEVQEQEVGFYEMSCEYLLEETQDEKDEEDEDGGW